LVETYAVILNVKAINHDKHTFVATKMRLHNNTTQLYNIYQVLKRYLLPIFDIFMILVIFNKIQTNFLPIFYDINHFIRLNLIKNIQQLIFARIKEILKTFFDKKIQYNG